MGETLPTGEAMNRLAGNAMTVRKIMDFVASYVRGLPAEFDYYEQTIDKHRQPACPDCLDKSEDYRKAIFDNLVIVDKLLSEHGYPYISWQPETEADKPLIGRTFKTYVGFHEHEPLSVGFLVAPFRSDPRRQAISQNMVTQIPANLIRDLIPAHEILTDPSTSGYNIGHAPSSPANQTPSYTTLLEPLAVSYNPIAGQPADSRWADFSPAPGSAWSLPGNQIR